MGVFLRDNIEAFAVAIAMALVIRHYCVEAFRIPTGSMMPTLYGDNKPGEPRRHGDRILVDKFAWMRGEPERWQVMVFQYPLNRNKNFIKRLIGLPDEWLAVADGDIWTSKDGEQWTIQRKPPGVRDQLFFPYWPEPRDGAQFEGKPCWKGDADWSVKGDTINVDSGDSVAGVERAASLRFDRRVLSYSDVDRRGGISRGSVTVGDIRFRASVDVQREGDLEIRIEEHGVTHRVLLGADESFLEVGGATPERRAIDFRIERDESFDLSFANVDDSLVLRIDGDELVFEFPHMSTSPPGIDPDFGTEPKDEGKGGLTLVARGLKAEFTDARVGRDLHYVRYSGDATSEKWRIPAGHYFAMGDNTNCSKDSRAWKLDRLELVDGTIIEWEPGNRSSPPPNATLDRLNILAPDEVFVILEDKNGLRREVRAGDVADTRSSLPSPFIPADHLIGRAFGVFWPIYVPPVYRGASRIKLIR